MRVIVTGVGVAAMFGLGWLTNPVGQSVVAADIPLPTSLCRAIGRELLNQLVPEAGIQKADNKPVTDQYSSVTCHVATGPNVPRQTPRADLSVIVNRYRGSDAVAHAEAMLAYDRQVDHRSAAYHLISGVGDEGYLTHGVKGGNDPVTSRVVARAGKDIVTVRYTVVAASQKLTDRTATLLAQQALSRVAVGRD
ncbi:hypothetical protein [Fodinicola acaciae]|uniref:hypothetical protein n=1 Tax=Fodinicola acaciae TaxID=2681555 RepID=UPI0013D3F7C3|nr:hypothetical protein [Fodinicola acaciae]